MLFYKKIIERKRIILLSSLVFVSSVFPALWYYSVIPQWGGNGVVLGIFDNQISFSRIREIVWFHFSAALPELYLNYATVLFFIIGIYFLVVNFKAKALLFFPYLFLHLLLLCYFLYEINMIDVVHDYYMFPFLPFILITFIIMPLTAYLRI